MKTIPIASKYAQHVTTFCQCMKLTQSDGTVIAVTTLERPLTVAGITYRPGYDPSDLVSTADLAVDNMTLTVLPDYDELLPDDVLAGRWDNGKFLIFEVDYTDPAAGINILKAGTTGAANLNKGSWTVEFRSKKQAFAQTIVQYTQKTCRYRLGSTSMPSGLCLVDLNDSTAGWTVHGTVTHVDSGLQFTDSSQHQAAEFFVEGLVRFSTGENAGYERKVKVFASGVFTLATPFEFAIGIGDTFVAVAGCQKRLTEDCIGKFHNVLNFGGEPHIVGTDSLTADPDVGGA